MKRISLIEKLATFDEPWTPRIIADLNDTEIKLAKLEGAFEWHSHADTDELFYVVSGNMRMRFRDRDEVLGAGDMIVVPKGVEHMPVAEPTAEVMLIEAAGTVNTGDAGGDRTVANPERI